MSCIQCITIESLGNVFKISTQFGQVAWFNNLGSREQRLERSEKLKNIDQSSSFDICHFFINTTM